MRRGRGACLVVLLLTALAACGSGSGRSAPPAPTAVPSTPAPTEPSTTTTVDPNLNTVATAAVPVLSVYEAPGAAEPVHQLENPQPSAAIGETAPLVLLVREQQPEWLKVLLPVRPNGSSGWVRASDVTLETHDYRILIELGAYRITVWQGDDVVLQEPVGLGTGATPTSVGLFYTKELLKVEDQPVFGPYAYALSGFSEVHYEFAGGPGTLGIHGTNDPSGLGRNVSNGCVRMSNEGITKLAETLPVGVPVEIRA
ncbi:MAG: L,D-transpeptidase family protein [Actinomycetota bacterium]|nr:L,D-transpeptidase family protein [Actinomycetota bacterium]